MDVLPAKDTTVSKLVLHIPPVCLPLSMARVSLCGKLSSKTPTDAWLNTEDKCVDIHRQIYYCWLWWAERGSTQA